MALKWPFKDPDEVLDYQIDWSGRLGDDTIVTSTWFVPEGITQDSVLDTTTTTTIWLSGGTDGESYDFTNRIVTADGRVMDQTVTLQVAQK
jgi:hypothetical protein